MDLHPSNQHIRLALVARTVGLPGAGFADGVAEMNPRGFSIHTAASTVPATRLSQAVWVRGVHADSNFLNDGFTSIGLRVDIAGWS
jgi:hypothetical protein